MAGRAQPPSAAQPCHLTPLLPGLRGRSAAAATGLPPPPFYSVGSQHSPPSATILHEMFNTCVARGIAAKLIQKTVDGKVEVSLHCSTMTPAAAAAASAAASAAAASAAAAAAGVTPKRKRKRPDNERRRMRREAWRQRCSAAAASAAAKSASGPAAAAATTEPGLVQPAAMAAATPPRAWALEKRDGLVVIARRLRTEPLESPEMTRDSEGGGDLNVSTASWAEERELAEDNGAMVSPITYAAAAAKGTAAAREDWSEEVERQELADPEEAKQCPVCLSRNRQPEKDSFSKLIRCNFCYTVH